MEMGADAWTDILNFSHSAGLCPLPGPLLKERERERDRERGREWLFVEHHNFALVKGYFIRRK